MRALRLLAIGLLLPFAPIVARAQHIQAQTVSACGTPNNSPVVGNWYDLTMDPTAVLCTNASGGGGGGGAVFGPTAIGSASAHPPVQVGGTVDGTATGAVEGALIDSSHNLHVLDANSVALLAAAQAGNITLGASGIGATPTAVYLGGADSVTATTGVGAVFNHANNGLAVTSPVGADGFTPAQTSCASTATLIAAARTGKTGTGRVSITVENSGTTDVYLGGSGVTTSTGILLPGTKGASATFTTTAAMYCIVASSTQTVTSAETF